MTRILQAGLLDGLVVAIAAVDGPSPEGEAVAARCAALGATVAPLDVEPGVEPAAPDAAVLVCDAARPVRAADGVRDALDGAWAAIRPTVAGPMAAAGTGKVLLLAPPPGGPFAEAVRAGLENLARTTSVEWARLGIRTVAILPGAGTAPGEVAEIAAYVASHAGDYYSGCAFTLGAA